MVDILNVSRQFNRELNRDESTLIVVAWSILKLANYLISKHASEGEDVQNNSRFNSLEDSTMLQIQWGPVTVKTRSGVIIEWSYG